MSSATSIKATATPAATQAGEPGPTLRGGPDPATTKRDGFQPWHFFVLLSLVGATAAVLMARQPSPEHLVVLSVTIGAAGACAAALYATLAPLVRKDSAVRRARLTERSRAALEREKMLVLRSIKELEFDRAMGKMSAADFDDMAGRLRARALALMSQLDAVAPVYRSAIEEELARRVERAQAATPVCSCGTPNDVDAVFCKRCGKRLR